MFVAGAGFEVDGHLHGEVLTTRLATIVYNQPCNTLVQQYLSADSTILTALIFFLEACFAIVCFPSLLFLPFNLFFLFFLTAKCSSSNSKFKASSSTLSADFVTWIWHSVDMGVWRYDLVVHWSEWKVNQTEPTHWYSPREVTETQLIKAGRRWQNLFVINFFPDCRIVLVRPAVMW